MFNKSATKCKPEPILDRPVLTEAVRATIDHTRTSPNRSTSTYTAPIGSNEIPQSCTSRESLADCEQTASLIGVYVIKGATRLQLAPHLTRASERPSVRTRIHTDNIVRSKSVTPGRVNRGKMKRHRLSIIIAVTCTELSRAASSKKSPQESETHIAPHTLRKY